MKTRKGIDRKTLDFVGEFKMLDTAGEFEGYGSVFGNIDAYGDVVMPNAFMKSLQNKKPAMLWQHDPHCPIGVWTECREDAKGLYVKGELNLETRLGKECYALLKQGALKGLSIGFNTVKSLYDEETDVRQLLEIDLWEVSAVTFPANDAANVEEVRSAVIPTVRELEQHLRDAGLSIALAKEIAGAAKPIIERRQREVDGDEDEEGNNPNQTDAVNFDDIVAKMKG